jgi:hypothetical protein
MKQITSFLLFLFLSIGLMAQQGKVTGNVIDQVTGKAISEAIVRVGTQQVTSDVNGYYEIGGLSYGEKTLTIIAIGFENFETTVTVSATTVTVKAEMVSKSVAENDRKGIAEINLADLSTDDESKEQSVSGLLHSSEDAFTSTASYTFSAAYFRTRGYDSEFSDVMVNGLSMSNGENGRSSYSLWGGLNDATRSKEAVHGLSPARFSFGGLNGVSNINVRASSMRKQTKFSYAVTNKTYTNRAMFTYSTGLMNNGWAFTVSASRRFGNAGYVEGTSYNAWSYFLSAEKKINAKHSVSLTAFGAPTKKGMQSAVVQEAYDLAGSNYYNPSWGYQEGEVRNARIRNTHEPVILLSHFFDIDSKTKLTTTAGYTFGKNGTTSLNWYNANDPRPDYYRYLPSYQIDDPAVAAFVTNMWGNETTRQINWDKLYQVNYLANSLGEQSKYIIEERRIDQTQFAIASTVNREINSHIFLSGGFDIRAYKGKNYKILTDLLGGSKWVDVDQFAERDFSGDTVTVQNDVNNPDRVIKTGDKFGYDYDAHVNSQNIWVLSEFSYNKFDFYGGLNITTMQYWRTGNMRNGRYPDNSYGDSETQSFFNYALKGGITYKITGRHIVVGNAMYMTAAPTFKNAYISPRTRDAVIPNLTDRKIISGDISYIIRNPRIKGRATLYQTNFTDESEANSFYHDVYRTYVNNVMVGMNKKYQGLELGVEVKANSSISILAVLAKGNFRYTNDVKSITSYDNGSLPDTIQNVYSKNFHINGTPQTAMSLGLKYQGPKSIYVNINANYYDDIWVDFNPERRTVAALDGLNPNIPADMAKAVYIVEQTQVDGQFTLDASISKSWQVKKYNLSLNFSVSNILDNKNLITSGYEQLRFDFEGKNVDKFPPKYYYGFGRTFFVSLGVRF